MLVGAAASFQHTPLAEKEFLSKTQVRYFSPHKFKLCARKFTGLGTDPSAPFRKFAGLGTNPSTFTGLGTDPSAPFIPKSPPVLSAEFLTQKRDSQSKPSTQKFKADRSFYQRQDLHSLKETLRQRPQDENAQSYNVSQRQDLQGLKGYFNQQADPQPKADVGLAQQGVPRADTLILDSKTRPHQAIPAHMQPDTQSKQSSSAASLGSPDVEKRPGSTFAITKGKDAHLAKRRGSRNSARGFDVLDELMSSQGRSSKAVLESLQSTVAIENDDMPYMHPTEKDALKAYPETQASPSFSGKVSTNEIAERKHGIMSQVISDFRRIDTWQLSNEATTDTAPTSSTFASSIEKALSPSIVAKANSTTSSTLASSRNVSVLQQSTPSEIHSGKFSEVAKPSLRGQEVMWALQKAAIEKAKQKQKARKVSDKASKSKEAALLHDSGEWRNAKPIVLKTEWALQIDELERRIENLKNPMLSS